MNMFNFCRFCPQYFINGKLSYVAYHSNECFSFFENTINLSDGKENTLENWILCCIVVLLVFYFYLT